MGEPPGGFVLTLDAQRSAPLHERAWARVYRHRAYLVCLANGSGSH